MSSDEKQHSSRVDDLSSARRDPDRNEAAWVEPKLQFIEPKLTVHGDIQHLTAGFFGTFSP